MNKRKIVLLAVALCMVAILGFGGTLAYLTDNEQAHNTFTVGDVKINIEEYTHDGTKFEDWQPSQLVPLDNKQGFDLNNKIVQTFNTSTKDNAAYIRTIVLFEKNKDVAADYVNADNTCTCFPGLHFGYRNVDEPVTNAQGITFWGAKAETMNFTVTIDGSIYYVVVFTEAQDRAIPKGDALYTLSSVWVDKGIDKEINGWGEKIDVIVLSQAIQAEGLTHAQGMTELGVVDEANVLKWVTGDNKAETAVINDLYPKTAPSN